MKYILKKIYDLIPFKSKIYNIIKVFWLPKESIYKHLHFKDLFTIKLNKDKKFKIYGGNQIENEIFWEGLTGKWEKESMKIWIELSKISNYIFDIGANTGIYALVTKSLNENAKVYAFEPHPLFFKMLRKNVKANNYDIEYYNIAISNYDGNISIADYSIKDNFILVNSIKLDTFIEMNNIPKIDVLKIDVEGFEPLVLEGFLKYLSQFKPTFLIEVLDENIAEIIFRHVKEYDYLYFNINEEGGIRKTEKIELSDSFNYLLCSQEIAIKLNLI